MRFRKLTGAPTHLRRLTNNQGAIFCLAHYHHAPEILNGPRDVDRLQGRGQFETCLSAMQGQTLWTVTVTHLVFTTHQDSVSPGQDHVPFFGGNVLEPCLRHRLEAVLLILVQRLNILCVLAVDGHDLVALRLRRDLCGFL